MWHVRLLPTISTLVIGGAVGGAAVAQAWPLTLSRLPGVIEAHCADCHAGGGKHHGFDLDHLRLAPGPVREAAASRAMQRVRTRSMPPADAGELPDAAQRRALLEAFAWWAPAAKGARVATIRRLTQRQYENTVHDLFGVDWHAGDRLPEDVRAHGFDGNGDVSGITPLQFESYLLAAREVSTLVLADAAARARVLPPGRPLAESLPPLLERAFRRPPTPAEVSDRERLAERLVAAGRDEAAAQAALLQSILASPAFLLRAEAGDPAAPGHLTAYELATRLSYTLTSSLPDHELFGRARRGDLLAPPVLLAEARRLLAATGGRRLAEDFAASWLRCRDVLTANADFRRYPEIWDGNLRPALHEEVVRLFAAVVQEDLDVCSLLDADFTFVDAALARLYGLPPVEAEGFVRVALPDRRRGGVLGTGAVLMLTSYPLRTSPVQRGRYVLEVLLDASTPPPPPNVPKLPADDAPAAGRSLREQLELHRRDKACAACHALLDPLGFGLEPFDVLGRWRDDLHGQPIDARGTLPDGTEIDGPIALKDALLQHRGEFVRTFVAKLLTFALGRPMLPADEPELQRLVADIGDDRRFSRVLAAVLTSPLFLRRDPDRP